MSRRKTTEEFISDSVKIHGDKYDYSLVEYVNSHTKVNIACPIHGPFPQTPANHLQGKGCGKCRDELLSKERRHSEITLLNQCNKIHNNAYAYDFSDYKNAHDKINIICKIHGAFPQTVTAHIYGKEGCPDCSNISRGLTNRLSIETFIEKSIQIHGDKYDYTSVNYTGWSNKVIILCPVHGPFKQSPRDHFDGCGCQQCAKHGFDPSKPAYLYYLKITTDDNRILYKIGITNRTVETRFSLTDLSKIEIVKQKLYENGQEAFDWELYFKRKYKQYQYQGPDILSSGNTELYTEDIYGKFIEKSQ